MNYDPSDSDTIQAMLKGETLSDTFTYTVTDEFGATSTTTVAVALSGGDDYIYGTTGNDEIKGSNNSDTIVGLGGRDKIEGRSGDDIIYGDYIGEAPEGVALLNPDNFKDDIHGAGATTRFTVVSVMTNSTATLATTRSMAVRAMTA